MERMRGKSLIAVLATAVAGALAPAASASPSQEAIIQDDPLLLNARSQDEADRAFATFKAIGVDRVRVSVFWNHVAPGA